MKLKPIRIFIAFSLIAFSLAGAIGLYAQDTSGPAATYEGNDEKYREPIYSPGEQLDQHHKELSSTLLKDSSSLIPKVINQQRPIKPTSENTKPESKQPADDSILSFNFLYYIIQKYKLQDIVD